MRSEQCFARKMIGCERHVGKVNIFPTGSFTQDIHDVLRGKAPTC